MKLETIEGFTVVGIGVDTDPMNAPKDCMPPWMSIIERYKEIPNPAENAGMGGVMYGPALATGGCSFHYLAAIEVVGEGDIPDGMEKMDVPGGKYAVYEHKGKSDTLGETYAFIMEDVKKQGLTQRKNWFEKYDSRYKHEQDDSLFEIWIGIE